MSLIVIKAINGSPVSVMGKFVGGSWTYSGHLAQLRRIREMLAELLYVKV